MTIAWQHLTPILSLGRRPGQDNYDTPAYRIRRTAPNPTPWALETPHETPGGLEWHPAGSYPTREAAESKAQALEECRREDTEIENPEIQKTGVLRPFRGKDDP